MATKRKSTNKKQPAEKPPVKKKTKSKQKPGNAGGVKGNDDSENKEKAVEAYEITQADLARMLGYSRARIAQIIKEPGCPVVKSGKQGRKVRIDVPRFMAWWVQRALEKELAKVPRGDEVGSLAEEEKKLVTWRARKVQAETRKLKGELVPVTEATDLLNELAVLYSSGLEAIPGRMANELSNIDNPAAIRSALFGEIRRVRKSVADKIRGFGAAHRGSDHVGEASGRPTTEDS